MEIPVPYMYNEHTDAHLIVLLYCSLFIAPTRFKANTSSSESYNSVPAKLHKRVHAVLVLFKKRKKNFHVIFFRIIKTLKLS
jgi:hypothetical protein